MIPSSLAILQGGGIKNATGLCIYPELVSTSLAIMFGDSTPPTPPHHDKGLVTFKMTVSGWNVTILEETMTFVLREKESGKFITCRYVNYTDETYSRSAGGYTIPCRDRYYKFTATLTDYSRYSSGAQVPAYTGQPHSINTTMLSTQNPSYYAENPDAKRDGQDPTINEIVNRYITLEIDPGTYEIIEVYCSNDDLNSITEFTVNDYTLDADGKMTVTVDHGIQYAKFDMSDEGQLATIEYTPVWAPDGTTDYIVYIEPILIYNNLKHLDNFDVLIDWWDPEEYSDYEAWARVNEDLEYSDPVTVIGGNFTENEYNYDYNVIYNSGAHEVTVSWTNYRTGYQSNTYDVSYYLEDTKRDFPSEVAYNMRDYVQYECQSDTIAYQYDSWYYSKEEYAQYGAENNVTYLGLASAAIKQAPYYTVP